MISATASTFDKKSFEIRNETLARPLIKTKIRLFPVRFLDFRPGNPFPKVPRSSCIFWDGRGPFLRHLTFFDLRSGPLLRHLVISDIRPTKRKPKKDAETATCYLSIGENSSLEQAQIKERPTWRSIPGSRALYDQMAPQLCLFYVSAKFDCRPIRHNPNVG